MKYFVDSYSAMRYVPFVNTSDNACDCNGTCLSDIHSYGNYSNGKLVSLRHQVKDLEVPSWGGRILEWVMIYFHPRTIDLSIRSTWC